MRLVIVFLLMSVHVFSNTPKIFNFRVENSNKNRVLFDVEGDISGLSTQGFTISGKSITSISTSGNYFTVSSAFDFWDNNTIRLENGDDTIHDFTLSYIQNNIPEPTANANRYVTTSATGGGNGLTEGTAWTFHEAVSKAVSGQTVWLKAGNYGELYATIDLKGTANSPIKFIGYKNTIGDIVSNYWDYGVDFDDKEMPTFTGTFSKSSQAGRGIYFKDTDYFILRNFQMTKYSNGIDSYPNGANANSNVIIDGFNGLDFWDGGSYGTGVSFNSGSVGNTNIRILTTTRSQTK